MRISPTARSYLRKRSALLMSDSCEIFRPGVPVVDRAAQQASRQLNSVIYIGACRFWQEPAGAQILMGDQLINQTFSYVSVPYNAAIAKMNDFIKIVASDDTTLLNKTMKIVAITKGGGLRGSRVYSVQFLESATEAW